MIKKQLIDKTFSKEERDDVNNLLNKIIKTEICLVVREGLDEWVSPSGNEKDEPCMAGFQQEDKCTVLTTSRPWRLADERIKNSQIDSLLEIEGISSPNSFIENILRCIIDQTKDLSKTVRELKLFLERRKLESLSSSPMLYVLVICTWIDTTGNEEHWKETSLCALYTSLLECLCKKANSETGYFNDSKPPPVHCFSITRYLQPNIEHLDKLAEAACKLLFSSERESSIVFDDKTLSNYFSDEEFTVRKMFALKAGILTNRKDTSRTRSSNSFVHKTVQEFLASYYIACNPHVIDEVIASYLKWNNNSYLEMSQVLIFLCGMNISAANELSALMDQCSVAHGDCFPSYPFAFQPSAFQNIIESGIKEAAANKRDLNLIWSSNTSNVQFLRCSLACDEPTSHFEFKLSSYHKLEYVHLSGNAIRLRDPASSATSQFPVWIVRSGAAPTQRADHAPILPSIKTIKLHDVTCFSTLLRNLLSTLLTLDHEVEFELRRCDITSCAGGAVSGSSTYIDATIQTNTNTLNIHISKNDSPGLWESLHDLNIKSLRLTNGKLKHEESFSLSLSSLIQLESLRLNVYDRPGLWKTLHGLHIKSLSISGWKKVDLVQSSLQSLSSLEELKELSIKFHEMPGLSKALPGLNIKSLTLMCQKERYTMNDVESLTQSISSLKHLETLTIFVRTYINLQLPQSLKYLNIYCNSLLPSELREINDTLSACTLNVETQLEFGCASFEPKDYIVIQQELRTLKNFKVKRFRVLDRKYYNVADPFLSLSDIGDVDNYCLDIENVKKDAYRKFIEYMDNDIIISMQFLTIPQSYFSCLRVKEVTNVSTM